MEAPGEYYMIHIIPYLPGKLQSARIRIFEGRDAKTG
jgi:hypothetical protein